MTPRAAVAQVRVPPRHCDAQGMMHASRPYEYFEDAFLAWLDGACGGYGSLRAAGYDFVIVESRCSYLQPARLYELITLEVRPISASRTAFTIALDMKRDDTTIAVGTVTYVAVRNGRPAEIPGTVRGPLGDVGRGGRGIDHVAAAELLSRLHEAQGSFYAGGGDAGLRAVLDPDVRWHVPGRNVIAGEYHGISDVLGYMAARRSLAAMSFRLYPGELLIGGDDRIASLTDGSAVIDGIEHAWSTIGLYRIRAGRICECHLLPLDPDEFDRIWQARSG
jgi:acyl-CoA thioesterase FadM/ketosteroid isomerase-like protein